MRLAIDVTSYANRRGYGRYTRELIGAMLPLATDHEVILVVEEQGAGELAPLKNWAEILAVPQSVPPVDAAGESTRRGVGDLLAMRRAVAQLKPDLVFFPTVYTWFPVPRQVKSVVCIHDAIAERFPEQTLPKRSSRFFWNLKVKWAIRSSGLVLTVSDFSARDISTHLGVAETRLRVTGEAPAELYQPAEDADIAEAMLRHGLSDVNRWFVYVGGFNPHKRVDSIIRAHAKLVEKDSDAPHLLLVGSPGDSFHGCHSELVELIASLRMGAAIHWTGFVDDADLRLLNAGAVGSLLVSSCEGFGLPAIEAAACGTPVIATTESPLPELLKGGGLFIEPGDEPAILRAMSVLAYDEKRRSELSSAALQCARSMSWQTAASRALTALEEAMK